MIHSDLNAASLTSCLVFVEETLPFHPETSWEFSARSNGFNGLDERCLYFFDKLAGFFRKSIQKKNDRVFHFQPAREGLFRQGLLIGSCIRYGNIIIIAVF